MSLLEKLIDVVENDNGGDAFFALKNILSIAASAMPKDGSLPTAPGDLATFRRVQRCLYELRKPTRPALRPDGIIWHGRADFVTEALIEELAEEVESWRSKAELQKWGQYISPGGDAVAAFADSDQLREFISGMCGELEARSYPSCLYYDAVGAHIKPHVDTDNFCINVNLMLRHTSADVQLSKLVTYPYDSEPKCIELRPGEMVVMYADCVVHTRTPIADGEVVRNITFGYKPAAEVHQNISSVGM